MENDNIEIKALTKYYQNCGMDAGTAYEAAWEDWNGHVYRNDETISGKAVSEKAIQIMNMARLQAEKEEAELEIRRQQSKNMKTTFEAWEVYPK